MRLLATLLILSASIALPQSRPTVWAGISASQAVAEVGPEAQQIMIGFAIVNDGADPLDANALFVKSELKISGVFTGDWEVMASNGIRPLSPIAPGKAWSVNIRLGHYFTSPGTYTVSWSIPGAKAAEIVVRIVPRAERR